VHLLVQAQQGETEPLDLFARQSASLYASDRLALEYLADELDDREDEAREALLDAIGLEVDAFRRKSDLSGHGSASHVAAKV